MGPCAVGTYDAIIASAADRRRRIDPAVLDALRLACTSCLDTCRRHAAVNESVPGRHRIRSRSVGFANAAAAHHPGRRTWQERIEAGALRRRAPGAAFRTSGRVIRRSVAPLRRKVARRAGALLEADNAPRCDARALPGLAEPGTRRRPTRHGLRPPGGDPRVSCLGGTVRVQDEGSQLSRLPWRSLTDRRGERWLICAGLVGRPRSSRGIALEKGVLEANEVVPVRAAWKVRHSSALPPRSVHEQDGRRSRPGVRHSTDPVDAPHRLARCAGPEARWRKSPADVAELSRWSCFRRARRPALAGSSYTCSPHLAETRASCRRCWRGRTTSSSSMPAAIADVSRSPIDPRPRASGSGSAQPLWPHRHGTDAMFLALLQRRTDRPGRKQDRGLPRTPHQPEHPRRRFREHAGGSRPHRDSGPHVDVMDNHFVPT